MPVIAILLIAMLIATFGFWKTLAALIGSVGVIILLVALGIAAAVASVKVLIRRGAERLQRF